MSQYRNIIWYYSMAKRRWSVRAYWDSDEQQNITVEFEFGDHGTIVGIVATGQLRKGAPIPTNSDVPGEVQVLTAERVLHLQERVKEVTKTFIEGVVDNFDDALAKLVSDDTRFFSSDGKGGLLAPEDFHSQEFKKALRNNGEEYG